ncbi:MAG: hypothetical protein NZ866_00055 [Patescibacteria group bacterium]|nr:hypothetical protein [Patescibacteria group bacterium]
MQEIIQILNLILRLLQSLIILGSIAIFVYLGLLFYFKKFDEVKKNLPYVILGLILLIAVYSLPLIILSFLERGPQDLDFSLDDQMINQNIQGRCQIRFIIFDNNNPILGINNQPQVNFRRGNCFLTIRFTTQPNLAYVLCQFGNDNRERTNCWGIYGEQYNSENNRVMGESLDFSTFGSLENLNPTKRLIRFPSQSNTIYCSTTLITQNLSVKPSNKPYIFVIFSATPGLNACQNSSSLIIKSGSNLWTRVGADAFDLITTSTR